MKTAAHMIHWFSFISYRYVPGHHFSSLATTLFLLRRALPQITKHGLQLENIGFFLIKTKLVGHTVPGIFAGLDDETEWREEEVHELRGVGVVDVRLQFRLTKKNR